MTRPTEEVQGQTKPLKVGDWINFGAFVRGVSRDGKRVQIEIDGNHISVDARLCWNPEAAPTEPLVPCPACGNNQNDGHKPGCTDGRSFSDIMEDTLIPFAGKPSQWCKKFHEIFPGSTYEPSLVSI